MGSNVGDHVTWFRLIELPEAINVVVPNFEQNGRQPAAIGRVNHRPAIPEYQSLADRTTFQIPAVSELLDECQHISKSPQQKEIAAEGASGHVGHIGGVVVAIRTRSS